MVSRMLVLILTTILYGGTTAQSACNDALTSLSPCLDYLTGGSSSPLSSCCSQFSTVVQSSPQCLCSVLNGNESSFSGFSFNRTLALNLPTACNVQTPSLSLCNAENYGPTMSPANAPIGSPQNAFSPSGLKMLPWSNESSSNKNMIILSLIFISLFLAKI